MAENVQTATNYQGQKCWLRHFMNLNVIWQWSRLSLMKEHHFHC